MELGKKLRKIRKSKGFTLKQLSESIGLSLSAISQYERGERTPTINTLYRIADVLNCSVSEFVSEAEFKTLSARNESYYPHLKETAEKAIYEKMQELQGILAVSGTPYATILEIVELLKFELSNNHTYRVFMYKHILDYLHDMNEEGVYTVHDLLEDLRTVPRFIRTNKDTW